MASQKQLSASHGPNHNAWGGPIRAVDCSVPARSRERASHRIVPSSKCQTPIRALETDAPVMRASLLSFTERLAIEATFGPQQLRALRPASDLHQARADGQSLLVASSMHAESDARSAVSWLA
ncbi:hypothetical protein WJX84_008890 [Apatococcus fuscideae]|uniref:Uncharacterized protein n=1 Tax=Apatococcus fuscideae TaxID=2026836 RepID=A0AAW1SQ63_9CHLO